MKLKTHKMTAKKVKISRGKKKKIMTKIAGHDHFNARETGKVGRNKRGKKAISKADTRNIRAQLPYS